MWFKWSFKYFPISKQMEYLREHGIMLGSRVHDGRKVFLYMLKSFFVEVVYENDSSEMEAERLAVFSNVNHLNQYLEKEFKSSAF